MNQQPIDELRNKLTICQQIRNATAVASTNLWLRGPIAVVTGMSLFVVLISLLQELGLQPDFLSAVSAELMPLYGLIGLVVGSMVLILFQPSSVRTELVREVAWTLDYYIPHDLQAFQDLQQALRAGEGQPEVLIRAWVKGEISLLTQALQVDHYAEH
ncbi:hypothetical protein D9M68_442630 [compost metagenome]